MKKKNTKLFVSILSFFLFLFPFGVRAETIGFSGNNSVYVGENITINMYVPAGIASVGGNLVFDSSYLEYVSGSGVYSGYTSSINTGANYKIGGFGSNTTGQTNIFSFTFKTKRLGTTQVSLANAALSNESGKLATNVSAKTISIVNPPSGNNNLRSLSTNVGGLNFNGSTNYNISVENNVTSINVSGEVEDSTATVNGFGTKSLNYGNNVINIVVRAQNGSEKTYTINVNRKDNRSNNNNLASLKVNGGELNPGFNKNTTSYSLSVPFKISNLNVTATPEDSKAKVSVHNTNLVAEETTDVRVVVTAENGSTKTYTIHTLRGKDPNKVLSTNNFLASLTLSDGLLSPGFNKEQENYIVYLPYEIENIEINYSVEDTKYATVVKEGPDKLSVGNNLYKLKVKAENESERVYTITVVRGKNLLNEDLSNDVYLKEIKISGGNLNQVFDKKINYYTYSGKDIKVEGIANNKNSEVKVLNNDGVYSIIVEAESGEIGVYTLVKAKNGNSLLLTIALIILIIIAFIVGYKLGKTKTDIKDNKEEKKIKRKNRKLKKEDSNQ